jgi:hypothetical protein
MPDNRATQSARNGTKSSGPQSPQRCATSAEAILGIEHLGAAKGSAQPAFVHALANATPAHNHCKKIDTKAPKKTFLLQTKDLNRTLQDPFPANYPPKPAEELTRSPNRSESVARKFRNIKPSGETHFPWDEQAIQRNRNAADRAFRERIGALTNADRPAQPTAL